MKQRFVEVAEVRTSTIFGVSIYVSLSFMTMRHNKNQVHEKSEPKL